MKHTMKSLGLVLMSALTVVAALASTAAAQFEFTSTPVTLTPSSANTQKIQNDSQSFISTMSYVNFSSGGTTGEIELVPNLKSITSERTTNHFPFLCPDGSSAGTYTGNFTLTGENSKNHVGINVD